MKSKKLKKLKSSKSKSKSKLKKKKKKKKGISAFGGRQKVAKRGLVSDESEISHTRDDLPKEENSGSRQIRWKLIERKKRG